MTLKGKYIQVALPDSLRPNTTYSMDFGDAIVDNNEGNPLGFYRYVFSTGTAVDTMELSGNVVDAESNEPILGMLVAFYEKQGDSIPLKELPDYIAKTDSSGYFRITNIRDTDYRIMAIGDANRDKMYTPEAEEFAWIDTLVHPIVFPMTKVDTFKVVEKIVGRDTVMRDSIVSKDMLMYGPSNLYLRAFKEKLTQLYLVDNERTARERIDLTFSIPADNKLEVELWDTLSTEPVAKDWFFKESNPTQDTVSLWIKDSTVYKKDTLHLILRYLKTDSLGQWVPFADTSRYVFKDKVKKNAKKPVKKNDEKQQFLKITPNVSGDMDLGKRFYFEFERPVDKSTLDSMRVSEKQDSIYNPVAFKIHEDAENVRRVYVDAEWKPGTEYLIEIDSAVVNDIYGRHNDKVETKLNLRKKEYYGTLNLTVSGVQGNVLIQIYKTSDSQSKKEKQSIVVLSEKAISKDGNVIFELLPEGKYKVRAVLDANNNGVWDTGLFLKHIQPEEIIYLSTEITMKQNFDIEQEFKLREE